MRVQSLSLRADVEREAVAAANAASALTDDAVAAALRTAARLTFEQSSRILAANAADCESGAAGLDEGTLDRLTLDEKRVAKLVQQVESMVSADPLEREVAEWMLPNGLHVSERRVPIGAVGANFEARPAVAVDVATQLLKSLNSALLRTGGAALRTVTVLVDEILRPALEDAGLPAAAVGLVRSADHEGARLLVTMPHIVPLVILRGSGETTAALARLAAGHGVRTLAHAEGGGVLYVHSAANPETALAVADASLDRLGVCNRLNLTLVDRGLPELASRLVELFRAKGLAVRGTVAGAEPHDLPLGHEWASDPERIATVTAHVVDDLDEALRITNGETSGLAAGIVTEDEVVARAFLDGYRGTVALWHATTRFADGFELTGNPETGINVDRIPGPRGPVTYRDLWLRQYRVVGDGTQRR